MNSQPISVSGPDLLRSQNLHVAYGQSEVIPGLSFQAAPNEIVAVMGRNGMGKTHAVQGAHRHPAGAAPAPSCSTARTSPARSRSSGWPRAWPTCRRDG